MLSKRLNYRAPCTIRNLSSRERVAVSDSVRVPLEFDLAMSDGSLKLCKVNWRRPDRLGVIFR